MRRVMLGGGKGTVPEELRKKPYEAADCGAMGGNGRGQGWFPASRPELLLVVRVTQACVRCDLPALMSGSIPLRVTGTHVEKQLAKKRAYEAQVRVGPILHTPLSPSCIVTCMMRSIIDCFSLTV